MYKVSGPVNKYLGRPFLEIELGYIVPQGSHLATPAELCWGVERFVIAIPKGRDQGMQFLRQFTNDVKSEGLVGIAIARAGLRGALTSAAE